MYFFHTESYQRSFDLLQTCYRKAKEQGLWLWTLKSSYMSYRLQKRLPSHTDLLQDINYKKQYTEILTQLSEPLAPDIQIRMLRHYNLS